MECNHERRPEAKQHVKIEPALGTALASEPSPSFAQRVEEDDQKHRQPQETQFQSQSATGFEKGVFGGKRAVGLRKRVVVEAVNCNREGQAHGDHISGHEPYTMTTFCVSRGCDCGGCYGCICAHLFVTCSSVLTANLL